MNQDSTINTIKAAQNITQAIINTYVPPTSKENTANKSDIENKGNTFPRESTEEDLQNENRKSKRKLAIILEDSTIEHTNG